MPDAKIKIDDIYWNDLDQGGCKTSVAYTLEGTNIGKHSRCGGPTNETIKLTGIFNGRLYNLYGEWMYVEVWEDYDELR